MQFLKTLFWVILAVACVIFSMRNWTMVPVYLWGGLEVEAKLPVLLAAAFLAGLLPPFVLHRATRWRLRRKLEETERALAEARAPFAPAPLAATASEPRVPVAAS